MNVLLNIPISEGIDYGPISKNCQQDYQINEKEAWLVTKPYTFHEMISYLLEEQERFLAGFSKEEVNEITWNSLGEEWKSLPIDLLSIILSQVSVIDLIQLARTCKAWNQIIMVSSRQNASPNYYWMNRIWKNLVSSRKAKLFVEVFTGRRLRDSDFNWMSCFQTMETTLHPAFRNTLRIHHDLEVIREMKKEDFQAKQTEVEVRRSQRKKKRIKR
jgi:hypothetical protein